MDNQNINQNSNQKGTNFSSVLPDARTNIRNLMERRRMANDAEINANKTQLINDTESMYSHNSASSEINEAYKRASNFNGIAYMIYDYSIANGAKNVPASPRDIMNLYGKKFPEKAGVIKNAVMDVNLDLDKFGTEQGWLPSDEDEDTNALVSWAKGIWDTFAGNSLGLAQNSVRNRVNSGEGIINQFRDIANGDEEFSNYNRSKEFGALENLAFMKYGKNVNQLTDREIANLQEMLQDEEVMKAYEASASKGMATGVMSVLDAMFTAFFPGAKAKISVAANTPVVNLPIEVLATLIQLGGRAINVIPGASNFREGLGAEEYKQLWDMAVASSLLTTAGGTKTVRNRTTKKLNNLAKNTKLGDIIRVYSYYKNKFVDIANQYLEGKAYNAGAKLKGGLDSTASAIKNLPGTIENIPGKVKAIPGKVADTVSGVPGSVLRFVIRNAMRLGDWGMEQYGKAKNDIQNTRVGKRVSEEIVDPAIDEYINNGWNLDKEILTETDPIKLSNANKRNTEATIRITKKQKTEDSTAFNDTLDRLSPEGRSKVGEEKILDDGSVGKRGIDELSELIDNEIMKPTMEMEDMLLENMNEQPMTKGDIDRITAGKSKSGRGTTESSAFKEGLEELMELENIEYTLEEEVGIDGEPTGEIKIKLQNETPTKSQADTYDLVDQYNNGVFNVKDWWNAMRRLNAKSELIKEDGRLPKKGTNKNDILAHYRTIKNTLRSFIEEKYPEYEGWFNELDKAYGQGKSSLAQIKNVSEQAMKETANKKEQTQLEKDLSNKKLSVSYIWNKILKNEPLSYGDIDSNINLLLKQHYESSKRAGRTGGEKFRDVVKQINELKETEQSVMDAKGEVDASKLANDYKNKLFNILKEMGVEDVNAEKIVEVKSESLFNERQEQNIKEGSSPLLNELQNETINGNKNPVADIMQEQKNIMIDKDKSTNTVIKRAKTSLNKLKDKTISNPK